MDTRRGGHRYCPTCQRVVETRVLLEGYCQTEVPGTPAKKHRVICGRTVKVQVSAGQGGLHWRYRRRRFYGQVGREELMERGIGGIDSLVVATSMR